jgi:hypothetical protein
MRRRCASSHRCAAWAKRGEQAVVVVSGRNARRVLHGALNASSGEMALLIRERSRGDACLAFVETLGQVHADVPKLLIWDNAPPHHPKRVVAAAEAAHIFTAFLPFRAQNSCHVKICGDRPKPWWRPTGSIPACRTSPSAHSPGCMHSRPTIASAKAACFPQSSSG